MRPSPLLPTLMNRLRLKQLALVAALGEQRNLHRAAAAINVTQPTATKMLHDVELVFGFPLFERLPRGMQPTELGREVVRFAVRLLADFDRFAEDLDDKRRGGYGQLVVGAIMGAAPDLVARAVADLKAKRPLLVVRLLGETSDEILDLLAERKIDLAVGRFAGPLQHNEFDFEPLANETLYVVARAGHPLAGIPALELRDLADLPWVVQPLTSPARQLLEQEFAQARMATPANVVEASSIFATLQLLQTSDAVAVLPESVVRDHLRAGLLGRLPLVIGKNLTGFGILTRKGEVPGAVAVEFLRALRHYAQAIGAQPVT
ncbi:LysR family transcriptional regulator [Azospirillum rugosum]|uniref:DNA-binding transcriptional LysR family regulator n=1 Tax=Azospirillum rugosum TaxID=416170 RepID=A0ABS4SG74_9PROT|nr:LysR family transcriptional regulator [Azospirillum rugosum]MBP2291564.1 DNA-binding transcriptional LysR family regulator [Azospirillum rugosum]MDQ0524624.1 DNA-binding transcriptional LysR family regulator [Azospirillum rugosum]